MEKDKRERTDGEMRESQSREKMVQNHYEKW